MKLAGIFSFILAFGSCNDNMITTPFTISYGTSFGSCLGYCTTETRVDGKYVTVSKIRRAPNPDTITQKVPISDEAYRAIVAGVDPEVFKTLPERIGCPDCADGGAEWIEVTQNQSSKRVTFEFQEDVEGIRKAVNLLRDLTEEHQPKAD